MIELEDTLRRAAKRATERREHVDAHRLEVLADEIRAYITDYGAITWITRTERE